MFSRVTIRYAPDCRPEKASRRRLVRRLHFFTARSESAARQWQKYGCAFSLGSCVEGKASHFGLGHSVRSLWAEMRRLRTRLEQA
jgi:hypothetical protein